ncbi:peptidylprolyl isomerase [Rhodobacteraceae bacterium SC52]|nr:peptidylprolyl isomerase [Rhodobacteraceae bacterium SC52]
MTSLNAIARRLTAVLLMTATCAGAPSTAAAQGLFDTVAQVNDSVVTRFEVVQRARLFQVMRRPNATEASALESLIDDRLKSEAGLAAGIIPTQEDIQFGLEDFAARANLTGEEMLIAVGEIGIEPETVRDYITVLLLWGEVVRERFTARARPSDAETDRAMALGTETGNTRVLLSEIILPVTPETTVITQERATAITEMRSFDTFSAAARRFSIAPSRNDGGRLGWMSLSDLPPEIGPLLLTLQPGDVTQPIRVQGGLALFQFRGLEDRRPPLAGSVTIDYALVRVPGSTDLGGELGRIRALTDQCDDLYGVFKGQGSDRLVRETKPRSELPGSLAAALDRLDQGELTAIPPQIPGASGSIVMMCERSQIQDEDLSREEVRRQLFARRLESFGDAYLAELRAAAFIESDL